MNASSANVRSIRYATTRMTEIDREKRVLIAAITVCLLVLPISVFSSLRGFLYGSIIVLELMFLMVDSAIVRIANHTKRASSSLLLIVSAILCGYLSFCLIFNGGNAGERIVQTAAFLLTLATYSRYDWNSKTIGRLKRTFGFLILASAAYWLVSGRVMNYYSAFYSHSNGYGVVLICAVTIVLLSLDGKPKAMDILMVGLCLLMLSFANSRSAIACLTVMALSIIVFKFGSGRVGYRSLATVVFALTLVGVLVFTIAYPSLYGTQLGAAFESFSREYFGKNFFSGRQIVWSMVLSAISGHEFFGLGLHYTPGLIYETTYSAHNLYLQTLLQSGIVGLALLLAVLWVCIWQMGKNPNWQSYVGSALIIGVLVHECLEVSLTQNNISVGITFWVLIGVALAMTSHKKIEHLK